MAKRNLYRRLERLEADNFGGVSLRSAKPINAKRKTNPFDIHTSYVYNVDVDH
jgi:hypothetical protein